MESVPIVKNILSVLVIAGQILAVILLIGLAARRGRLPAWAVRLALPSSFLVAVVAMFGSLFFSEIAKFPPCELCWYQRILMYPLVFLFATALIRKETVVAAYALPLAVLGAIVAVYHYTIQLGVSPLVPCSANSFGVSCAEKQTLTFGYITIPVMAMTAFLLIAIGMTVLLLEQRRRRVSAA